MLLLQELLPLPLPLLENPDSIPNVPVIRIAKQAVAVNFFNLIRLNILPAESLLIFNIFCIVCLWKLNLNACLIALVFQK